MDLLRAMHSSIAPSPGSVAGIFTNRFGLSTHSCSIRACSIVASRSYARSGSTSSETYPSCPLPPSQTGRKRSHASLMSATELPEDLPRVLLGLDELAQLL